LEDVGINGWRILTWMLKKWLDLSDSW
jgi:hypothetical protein